MHTIHPALTHPHRRRCLTLLLGVGLLTTSRLSAALAPDDQELSKTPAAAAPIAAPSTAPERSNRDLILSVTALLGVLVGMERLATWRVGVRHRRGAADVAFILSPPRPGGPGVPEISPVAWRTVRPRHRSSGHLPRTTPG